MSGVQLGGRESDLTIPRVPTVWLAINHHTNSNTIEDPIEHLIRDPSYRALSEARDVRDEARGSSSRREARRKRGLGRHQRAVQRRQRVVPQPKRKGSEPGGRLEGRARGVRRKERGDWGGTSVGSDQAGRVARVAP